MIKNITAAYVLLIGIFGVTLIVGSVKSTLYPDEKVYTPGKIVMVYHPDEKNFTQHELSEKTFNNYFFNPKIFQANMFQLQSNQTINCPKN